MAIVLLAGSGLLITLKQDVIMLSLTEGIEMTNAVAFLLLACALLGVGCNKGLQSSLDPTSLDPSQDHWRIASYFAQEAVLSRQKAEEQAARVRVYERLFGHESDWVSSAQLLSRFYEEAAREQDRQANLHLELASRKPPPGR